MEHYLSLIHIWLGQQMDSLDITDRFYEKKYQDMETRLNRLYDEIAVSYTHLYST